MTSKPVRSRKAKSGKTKTKAREIGKTSKYRSETKSQVAQLRDRVASVFSKGPRQLTDALKMDHDSLRNYISVLKDTDTPIAQRKSAYKAFASLLKSHSVAEEQVAYQSASQWTGRELKIKVAEGYVEHQVCDDLMDRIAGVRDPLSWTAQVNVLAELIEHHLKEEEKEMFPLIRSHSSKTSDEKLIALYVAKRAQTQRIKSEKNMGVLGKV